LGAVLAGTATGIAGESGEPGGEVEAYASAFGVTVQEAGRRLEKRGQMDAAGEIVYANEEFFGGVYLTHVGDLVLNITVVDEVPGHLVQAITNILPTDVSVKWHTVEYSLAELRAVRDEIVGTRQDYVTLGTSPVSVGIMPDRNAVILTLDKAVPPALAEVHSRYGRMVEVVEGAHAAVVCTSRTDCTPWRGGIKIDPTNGGSCTYGYNAKRVTTGAFVMLTAGHCATGTWRRNGVVIGSTTLNNLATSNRELGDFQRVSAAGLTSPRNLVYRSNSNKSWTITGRRQYSFQWQYDLVSKSGVSTGLTEGKITDPEHRYWIQHSGEWFLVWGKRADFNAALGDSGAPVFWGNNAYGLVSGIYGSNDSVYGTADYAEMALGVTLCFTSSC
jgi:hypothetical protein